MCKYEIILSYLRLMPNILSQVSPKSPNIRTTIDIFGRQMVIRILKNTLSRSPVLTSELITQRQSNVSFINLARLEFTYRFDLLSIL
ncbi:hypothetical protein M8J75_010044 [Diaphorina citri]|nr:hypothetical protein M8J75_010044 [Diaphorina citri]